MLSNYDMRGLRKQQVDDMPDRCNIYRTTRADDGFGGWAPTGSETTVAENVPIRVTPAQMLESLGERGRPVETSQYTGRVPIDTEVKDEDFIVLESGIRMQVERVKRPRSHDTALTLGLEIVDFTGE